MNLKKRLFQVKKLTLSLVRRPIRTVKVLHQRAKTKPIRRQISAIDLELENQEGDLALVRRSFHQKKTAFENYQQQVLEPEQREGGKRIQVDEHSRKIILSGESEYTREKKIMAEIKRLQQRKLLLIKQARKK